MSSLTPPKVLLVALALVACAPASLRERIKPKTDVIAEFRVLPDRGKAAKFKLNEQVSIEGSLAHDGYLTLLTVDPDRTTVELERNIKLSAGTFSFPRSDDRVGNSKAAYLVVEPLGTQLVYAIYTEQPNRSAVRFNGVLNPDALERRVRDFLEQNPGLQDVAELEFEVIK